MNLESEGGDDSCRLIPDISVLLLSFGKMKRLER